MIGGLEFVTTDTGFAASRSVVDAPRWHREHQQGDRHRERQPDDSTFSPGEHDDGSAQPSAPPGALDIIRGVVGDRHDGEHRVEAAVGHVDARVDHEHVVHVVELAVFVND